MGAKYRRKVFVDARLKKLCEVLLDECARRYEFEIEDRDVQVDHVHVLVKLRPSMSPAKAVHLMKGYTSRLMFLAEPQLLRKFYYKPERRRSLWGDGKFMASVGHITLDKAKEYLERQDAHHADFINLESPPFMVGEEVKFLSFRPKGDYLCVARGSSVLFRAL